MKNNLLYALLGALITTVIFGTFWWAIAKTPLPRKFVIIEDVDLVFHYRIPEGFAEVSRPLEKYKDWTVYVRGRSYLINFVFSDYGNRKVIVVRGSAPQRVLSEVIVVKGRE